MLLLGVNIDHIATLRNARGVLYPSVIEAALIAETSGADQITLHLREDRRHIKDKDVFTLREVIKTKMNLEMAITDEMLQIALKVKPDFVCLVPEKREELTTEGGLDVNANLKVITNIVLNLQQRGTLVSVFIEPDEEQIKAAHKSGCYAVEIHTGKYSSLTLKPQKDELEKIRRCSLLASSLGLIVNAGHGLNYHNVIPIAQIEQINELNIGHAIIGQSIFIGLACAVKEMKRIILEARGKWSLSI